MCGITLIAEAVGTSGGTDRASSPGDGGPGTARAAAGPPLAPPRRVAPAGALPRAFLPALRRRGPDALGARAAALPGAARLLLASSLLQLRGAARVAPPLASPGGGVLCFNGELFGGLPLAEGANDGAALLAALDAAPEQGAGPAWCAVCSRVQRVARRALRAAQTHPRGPHPLTPRHPRTAERAARAVGAGVLAWADTTPMVRPRLPGCARLAAVLSPSAAAAARAWAPRGRGKRASHAHTVRLQAAAACWCTRPPRRSRALS